MNKIIGFLFLLLTSFGLHAQDSIQIQRDHQLQQLLGMNEATYRHYKDSLHRYNKHLTAALNDAGPDKKAKGEAVAKALQERKAYLLRHLSEAQRRKLYQFHRRHAPVSPNKKRRQALEERLKKRGITVIKPNDKK